MVGSGHALSHLEIDESKVFFSKPTLKNIWWSDSVRLRLQCSSDHDPLDMQPEVL